jgi:choline transport protein
MLTIVQREWNFWAVLGFSSVTLCTWEAMSALFSAAYTNGGPASVVYGFIVSVVGTLMIAASMAEMASMLVLWNSLLNVGYLRFF